MNTCGDSFSMAPRAQWNVIVPNSFSSYPRRDERAHYPSKCIPNLDHCEVVYTLCVQVLILLNYLWSVWSKYWPLPTYAEKLASSDT